MTTPHFEDKDLPPNWAALEQLLLQAPQTAPRPGFARRWLARQRAGLAAEQQAARRRTAGLLLASSAATIASLAIWLRGLGELQAQPGSWLAAAVQYVSKLAAAALAFLELLAGLALKLSPAAWVLVSTTVLAAMLLAAVLFSNVSWNKGELE